MRMRISILLAVVWFIVVAWCIGYVNPVAAATPPGQPAQKQAQAQEMKKLSEIQIANFWRAKSNLQTAAQAFEDAKKALDAQVQEIKATCGRDGQFGPDGHPSCGPEVPVAAKPEVPVPTPTPSPTPEVKK